SGLIKSLLTQKKRACAHSRYCLPTPARRLESSGSSIASARAHPTLCPRCVAARAVAVEAVILALGAQRARQCERLAGLVMAAQLLHRAPQAEQRVVVRGRPRRNGLELLRGVFVAPGMKQGATQGLTDGSLVGLHVAGFAERHDGCLMVAVGKQVAATLVEVIDTVHR